MESSGGALAALLRLMVIVGTGALVFGMSYAFLALKLYGGRALVLGDVAPSLLRTYCVYVPLLALNGVSEAFLFATLSQREIDRCERRFDSPLIILKGEVQYE